MTEDEVFDKTEKSLAVKALAAAVILSSILVTYLLWTGSQERYTMIYIYPESYSNYVKAGGNVSFRYGVYSHEGKVSEYAIKIYVGEKLLESKTVTLKNGETWEENVTVKIPGDVEFPVKLRVVAEVENRVYEAYFWLKEMKTQ